MNGIKKSTNIIIVAYMQLIVYFALARGGATFLLLSGQWMASLAAGRLKVSAFRDIGSPGALPRVCPF